MGSQITIVLALLMASINTIYCWNYDAVEKWPEYAPACAEKAQSPIDVTGAVDGNYQEWKMQGYDANATFKWENTGHGVKATTNLKMNMSGGNLKDPYCFDQIHFHWGTNEGEGSEHNIRGQKYPVEMHLVHHKCIYCNFQAAMDSRDADALAVLGVMFQTKDTKRANIGVVQIVKALKEFQGNDHSELALFTTQQPINLEKLLKNVLIKKHFRYKGSLTTPPCTENVIWTVFEEPVYIQSWQLLKALRTTLTSITGLKRNFRPVQGVNGRDISRSGSSRFN